MQSKETGGKRSGGVLRGLMSIEDEIYEKNGKAIVSDVKEGFDRVVRLSVNDYEIGVDIRIYLQEYVDNLSRILGDMERLKKFVDPLSSHGFEKGFDENALFSSMIKRVGSEISSLSSGMTNLDSVKYATSSLITITKCLMEDVRKATFIDEKTLEIIGSLSDITNKLSLIEKILGDYPNVVINGKQNAGKSTLAKALLMFNASDDEKERIKCYIKSGTTKLTKHPIILNPSHDPIAQFKCSFRSDLTVDQVDQMAKKLTGLAIESIRTDANQYDLTAEEEDIFIMECQVFEKVCTMVKNALSVDKDCISLQFSSDYFQSMAYGYFLSSLFKETVVYDKCFRYILCDNPGGEGNIDVSKFDMHKAGTIRIHAKSTGDLSKMSLDTESLRSMTDIKSEKTILVITQKSRINQNEFDNTIRNIRILVDGLNKEKDKGNEVVVFLVDSADQGYFDTDGQIIEDRSYYPPLYIAGSIQLVGYIDELVNEKRFESARQDVQDVISVLEDILSNLEEATKSHLDSLIPEGMRELNLGDLSQSNLTEKEKNEIYAHQEIYRLNKRMVTGQKKLKEIEYGVNVTTKEKMNLIFDTVSEKYESVFRKLIYENDENPGEKLRGMLRENYNRDNDYKIEEVEIRFRRSEKDRGYKIIEASATKFAEELFDHIFSRHSILDLNLETSTIEALSTTKQKFDEFFYIKSSKNNKKDSFTYDKTSFVTSIRDGILRKANYLLSYYINHMRQNGSQTAWIGIQNDRFVLHSMGINMELNKHADDDIVEQIYNIRNKEKTKSPPPSSFNTKKTELSADNTLDLAVDANVPKTEKNNIESNKAASSSVVATTQGKETQIPTLVSSSTTESTSPDVSGNSSQAHTPKKVEKKKSQSVLT